MEDLLLPLRLILYLGAIFGLFTGHSAPESSDGNIRSIILSDCCIEKLLWMHCTAIRAHDDNFIRYVARVIVNLTAG